MTPSDLLWIWRPWVTPFVVILLCYFGYKMFRQLGASASSYSTTSSGLDKLNAAVFPLKYAMPFLAILFFIVPDIFHNGPTLAPMPVLGAAIAVASFGAARRYEHHPSSVRALLLMLDVALFTIGTALPLGVINMARDFAKNYSLYGDHAHIYAAVILVGALGVFVTKVPGRIRQQIVALRYYVRTGITSDELYNVLTAAKGSKETINNWGPQRFAAIMAPLAIVFVTEEVLGGGDYVLYSSFLLILPVAGVLVSLAMIRRAYILKYLRTRDVIILDRWER